MTPALEKACGRAVHVVTPEGEVLRAGRATLYVLEALGFRRTVALWKHRPFSWLVEPLYRLVARHRGWLGKWTRG